MLFLGLFLRLFLAQRSSLAARSLLALAAAVPLGRQWGPGRSAAGRTALPGVGAAKVPTTECCTLYLASLVKCSLLPACACASLGCRGTGAGEVGTP